MSKEYYNIVLFTNRDLPSAIKAKQGDAASRFLRITLVHDDGTPYDLTGCTVYFNALKPDNTHIFNDAVILNEAAGQIEVELTDQTLAIGGKTVNADISVHGDGNRRILTTRTFSIDVQTMIRDDDAIESSNEYGAVVTLFQDVYDMREVITEMNDRLGEKDSDSSVEGNSDGLFSLANIAAKINRIMNYLVTQSTAGIVETVNAILGRIGTPDSVGDDTVMGKLNSASQSALTFLKPSDNLRATLVGSPITVSTSAVGTYDRQKISEPFYVPFDGTIKIVVTLTLTKINPSTATELRVIMPPNFRVSSGDGNHPVMFPAFMFESPIGTVGSFSGVGTPDRIIIGIVSAASTLSETKTVTATLKVNKGDVIAPMAYYQSGQANVALGTVDFIGIYYDEVS